MQASTLEALERYARQRDRLCPHPATTSFFVSLRGTRLDDCAVQATFRRLCDATGVGAGAPFTPRLHDFRHSLAVNTLLDWYRAGVDVHAPPPALSTYLGHRTPLHLLLPLGRARAARARRPAARRRPGGPAMTLIAPTLQAFFTDRLTRQLQASPRTIASYRDTPEAAARLRPRPHRQAPSALDWDDLDEPLIAAFLDHLETDRHNSPRTRNLRLTAIRSLFNYAALRHPEHAAVIARVLAIPPKRFERRTVTYLTSAGIRRADRRARPQDRWEGRRDHAMLTLAIHAGLRVSELIGLNCGDVVLGTGAHVRCHGKGRKQRAVPLTKDAQAVLAVWLDERAGQPDDPLFPTRTGRRLSRDAVEQRVATHATTAASAARRSQASACTHTCSATAARCRCCKPASTPPSSRSGSDTPTSAPPSPTSTPTSPSKKARSRSSPRPPSRPAATSPPDALLAFLEGL